MSLVCNGDSRCEICTFAREQKSSAPGESCLSYKYCFKPAAQVAVQPYLTPFIIHNFSDKNHIWKNTVILERIFPLLSPRMWTLSCHVGNLHSDPSSGGILVANLVHQFWIRLSKATKWPQSFRVISKQCLHQRGALRYKCLSSFGARRYVHPGAHSAALSPHP